MRTTEGENFRKDPESTLSLLLIRRGEHPFLGQWALPGGFLRMDETVEECALREAREETGITPTAMLYLGVFTTIFTSGDTVLRSHLAEHKTLCGDAMCATEPQPLAFDHAVIVASALKQLKTRASSKDRCTSENVHRGEDRSFDL